MTRLEFLAAGGLTAAGILTSPANAADPTPSDLASEEQAALDLVNAFCASFASRDMNRITSFLAEGIVYRITDTVQPRVGPEAIAQIRNYVESSDAVTFEILDSWAKGPIVVNERIDRFTAPNRNREYHLTGVFLVRDGKIQEWTDYSIR